MRNMSHEKVNNQFMQSDLLQYLKRSLRAQNAKPDKIKTYHIEKLATNMCNQNCSNTRKTHRERKITHEN